MFYTDTKDYFVIIYAFFVSLWLDFKSLSGS